MQYPAYELQLCATWYVIIEGANYETLRISALVTVLICLRGGSSLKAA